MLEKLVPYKVISRPLLFLYLAGRIAYVSRPLGMLMAIEEELTNDSSSVVSQLPCFKTSPCL